MEELILNGGDGSVWEREYPDRHVEKLKREFLKKKN